MDVYEALSPTTANWGAQIYLHVVGSCTMPPGFPQLILGGQPQSHSQPYTIPHGARWVVAWTLAGTARVEWSAQ
jgi:hypothetical protein